MRELRPLLLPKLVARQSAASSAEAPTSYPHQAYHSATGSDVSSPTSPTFSRGHSRYPSSNSSLSSTPPLHESAMETINLSKKTLPLPDVEEEPTERDEDGDEETGMLDDDAILSPCFCDVEVCAHQFRPKNRSQASFDAADPESLTVDLHATKRQRSGDLSAAGIATRIETRFPSLSRRWRDKKATSSISAITTSGLIPSRRTSMRRSPSLSNSMRSGFEPGSSSVPLTPSRSVRAADWAESIPSSPIDIIATEFTIPEPIDRQALASTPLLPPTMMDLAKEEPPVQSPLQSPKVVEPFSIVNTPAGTPPLSASHSPELSSKPSTSSFHMSRSGHFIPSAEIPSLTIADPNDEWAMKLGHANFDISPSPYLPEVCDRRSQKQLLEDWEQARFNFTKHLVRTGEHFGTTSKTYKLTEEKWASLDAQWKRNNEIVVQRALESGEISHAPASSEPAPLMKVPTLNDPKGEGKFPQLGDDEIVGPMVQLVSQIQRKPSKKSALLKFLTDLKLPGASRRNPLASRQ